MKTALPQLFQALTAADWDHLRAKMVEAQSGDVETVMTSVGYVDLHVGDYEHEGRISAQSFDHEGRDLQHRSVEYCDWPSPIELAARAYRLAMRARSAAARKVFASSPESIVDHRNARDAEQAARDALDLLLGLEPEKEWP